MKLALIVLVVLPLAMSAKLNDRFLETLTGGVDVFALANQLAAQLGTDESEQQCETQLCPPIVDAIDFHNSLITDMVCGTACKQAQVIAQHAGR